MTLQHLRSSTADKRPTPGVMSDGQLALNTNLASPGLFFKDSNGDLVKVGPVHIGTTAPNATPASGGQAGNSKGELWLDTTGSDYTLKTWDGSAWREIVVTSTMIKDGTIVNADINASAAIVDTKLDTIATAGKVSNSATTATSANTNSAIVARDGSGNFTAGTITAALTGAASANVLKAGDTMTGVLAVTAGTAALPAITPSGDPNTGIFSPGADQLAISTNGTGRLTVGTTAVSSTLAVDHPLGAVGTPSITFTGDLNTGFWSPAADTLAASTGGSERLRILSDGKVGLGTSSPDGLLTVDGETNIGFSASGNGGWLTVRLRDGTAANAAGSFSLRSTASSSEAIPVTQPNLLLRRNSNNAGTFLAFTNDRTGYSGIGSNTSSDNQHDLRFFTGAGTEQLRITGAGNVGIGTTGPSAAFHVVGGTTSGGVDNAAIFAGGTSSTAGSGARIYLTGTPTSPTTRAAYIEAVLETTGNDHSLRFATNAPSASPVERARIDSSGRLLVGTSTASGTSAGSVTATAGIFSTNRATGTISNGNSISVTVPTRGAGFCYLVTASRREGTADNKQGLYLVHYALDQLPQAVIALNALASMTLSASTDQITLTNNLGFNTAATLCAVRIG